MELETVCGTCHGNGRVYRAGYEGSCGDCEGVGYVMTEDGLKLYEFLSRRRVLPGQSETDKWAAAKANGMTYP